MKCLKCEFENPPGTKFCGKCGQKFNQLCPRCNWSNPPEFKFCGECGQNLILRPAPLLRDLSFDEKLTKIQKYLPGGLTEKILAQRDKIEGERRHITIMFVDMKGFTPLTEKLGPEETFSLIDRVFEILIHKVHEYGGTVNELLGDGILALFGAPRALEDAPQRAIHAALAIFRQMTRFNEKIRGELRIPPIELRIGINSGPVVAGSVGNDLRVHFTAVGDTINMAARIEQIAEPGTIYVTDATFQLTEGFFRFEALGEMEIKGKEKPAKVYRVIAPTNRITRFDVSAERGLTTFVGRQRELETLLDVFEWAKGGRGQAVSIVGEAGVGKSRLLYEFRKVVSNEDVTFLEGKCRSYGGGVAYHPIVDFLKLIFDIQDKDSDSVVTDKVSRRLDSLGVDKSSTLPYLLELLSVEATGIDSMRMSPESKRDRILNSLQRIVLKGSERRPLVLALEDLHWTDKSSEESAKYLMESIPAARVLMIFTYRPQFVHTWGARSFHSHVNLNRLSNRESLAMVAELLGSKNLSDDLQEVILEKTEGVPFFIEEFVRALRDMQIIKRTDSTWHLAKDIDRVTIPSTVQDVIMARVDSLGEGPRSVLQAGSAIEREFSYKLIKAVTDFPEQELLVHLSALKDAELLYGHGISPNTAYVFRHAVTREVVYDSMLTTRQRILHQKIGEAIEVLHRDSLDDYHSVLADHFMLSEDFQKSAYYSRLTCDRAWKKAALPSAFSYTRKRIAALERLVPTQEVQLQLIDARTTHGLNLFMAGRMREAKEAIEPIAELTLKSNDKRLQAQVYFILGEYKLCMEEDFPPALELLQKAMQNAEESSDLLSATLAYAFYGLALCWNCQFEMGAKFIQKVLSANEAAQILWGVSVMNSNLSYYAYNYQGRVEEGFAISLKALEIGQCSGDILSQAIACVCHGISCFYKGLFKAAYEHLLKGIDLCKRIELQSYEAAAHQGMGYTCFEMGDYVKSQAHYRQAILVRQRSGIFPSCLNLNRMASARAGMAAGETDVDVPLLRSLIETNRVKLYRGIMARHLAEILLQLGEAHFSEAEFWLQEAILEHERLGMMWDLASDYGLFAQLMKSRGRTKEEKVHSNKSMTLFNECGAEGWLRKIETGPVE